MTKSDGTTAIGSALVQIKKGGTLNKQVYTAANGTYTTGLVLKPATYTVVVTKVRVCVRTYTPSATPTVGANATVNVKANP